jgi:hypothetical protein
MIPALPRINLPLVLLISVVQVDDSYIIFRGLGEDDSWKKLKQKILWHFFFKKYLSFIQVNIPLPIYPFFLQNWAF